MKFALNHNYSSLSSLPLRSLCSLWFKIIPMPPEKSSVIGYLLLVTTNKYSLGRISK